MEPAEKNRPNKLVLILFSMIVLTIVIYFIFVMFFPSVIEGMTTGTLKPTQPDK